MSAENKPVLEVEELSVSFRQRTRKEIVVSDVVKQINFDLYAGNLALVGESGPVNRCQLCRFCSCCPIPRHFIPQDLFAIRELNLLMRTRRCCNV